MMASTFAWIIHAFGLVASPYETLRAPYERDKLLQFFASRPLAVTGRSVEFAAAYRPCREMWESAEGRQPWGAAAARKSPRWDPSL